MQDAMDEKLKRDPLLQKILNGISSSKSAAKNYEQELILNKTPIFKKLRKEKPQRKVIAYISNNSPIIPHDIAPLGSMLRNYGTVDNLDLIIHSTGGMGVTAEKIVDMCRQHCINEFRVVVPNMAKSAATMIALGADKIVMGYCSELGPIDAQITIAISGVEHQLSAQSFIDARKDLFKNLKDASDKERVGYLQQLASSTMEPAFINECQRQLNFAQDMVKKYLREHMLKIKFPNKAKLWLGRKATSIAKNLTSANKRFEHGRMIGTNECESLKLNIVKLEKDSLLWNLYWELYVRAEVLMMVNSKPGGVVKKLFLDETSQLLSY